jgi:hypothetical protein
MPTETKPSSKKRKLFTKTPKFFTSPVKLGKKTVTIELPVGILAHMEFTENQAHWTIINGVLQISGNQPQVVIPMLTNGEFESQD